MDSRNLQIFLAVIDTGSAGRAAQRLAISQPAVTQAIAKLEEKLKVKLFDRSPRGMVPTRYGDVLATRARSIVTEARYIVDEIDALRDGDRGQLAVGTGPSMASWLVPQVTHDLLTMRPKLTVRIVEAMSDYLFPALQRGELDILVSDASGTEWEKEFASELILHDSVTIFARSDHRLLQMRTPTLRDALAFPWVLPHAPETLRTRLEGLFKTARLPPPKATVETDSVPAMKALLEAANYLTFVPRTLFSREERENVLAAVMLPGGSTTRAVYALYRQRESLSTSARTFVSRLHRIATKQHLSAERSRK